MSIDHALMNQPYKPMILTKSKGVSSSSSKAPKAHRNHARKNQINAEMRFAFEPIDQFRPPETATCEESPPPLEAAGESCE